MSIRGSVTPFPRTVIQSGSLLTLSLVGNTKDEDALGRPTHLTWQLNQGSLGGTFTNATNPGGTLDIRYRGGDAVLLFKGLISTTGTTNILITPTGNRFK